MVGTKRLGREEWSCCCDTARQRNSITERAKEKTAIKNAPNGLGLTHGGEATMAESGSDAIFAQARGDAMDAIADMLLANKGEAIMPDPMNQTADASEFMEKPDQIDPEICAAVEYWCAMKIQERAGRGTEYEDGDKGYGVTEWFKMLFEECPAVIKAILQAGAQDHVGYVSYMADGSAQLNEDRAPEPEPEPKTTALERLASRRSDRPPPPERGIGYQWPSPRAG